MKSSTWRSTIQKSDKSRTSMSNRKPLDYLKTKGDSKLHLHFFKTFASDSKVIEISKRKKNSTKENNSRAVQNLPNQTSSAERKRRKRKERKGKERALKIKQLRNSMRKKRTTHFSKGVGEKIYYRRSLVDLNGKKL